MGKKPPSAKGPAISPRSKIFGARKENHEEPQSLSFPVVGIGASAGGLEAFTELLKHLPTDTGMGFVLVQHLDPQHESALTQLLARVTSMPVCEVTDNLRIEANHVYVIPPNTNLAIKEGVLKLQARPPGRTPPRSIDFFFESLAQDHRERAIGVILSGTATDGTIGLEAIKAEGGITFAQDGSAKYDSMPRSAAAAGCVDFVCSPEIIARELAQIARHPYVAARITDNKIGNKKSAHEISRAPDEAGGLSAGSSDDNTYKKILLLLRNHSSADFSLYKSATIRRRITRRMVLNKIETQEAYVRFLEGNAKELEALYADCLINVTSFFRNPEAFELLKRKIFPKLLQQQNVDTFRVWVLGCSTGQEAYSIAMAFMEEAEKSPRLRKLQIFASDLNDALLDRARNGLYSKNLVQDVPPERLRRFFTQEEGGYRVNKPLREMVVFARQNLISDPPFSRMDLISCRNLINYLESDLQKQVLPTFHYALKPGGFLFLGASESVGSFTGLFEPVDKKQKIYSRKSVPTPLFHLPMKKRPVEAGGGAPRSRGAQPGSPLGELKAYHAEFSAQIEADRITVNQFAPPGVLINDELQILQFRGPTNIYLQPPTGKASFDLLKMAREGLMLSLRAAINQARKENKIARREKVRFDHDGKTRRVSIEVVPLKNLKDRCFLVLFENAEKNGGALPGPAAGLVSAPRFADQRKESRRLAELERELAETRDYLQAVQEQNETTNEELQASYEEVTSANEELQSVNEELETSKEELESANEELTTVNEEMSHRNVELGRLNADLNNLQASTRISVILIGRNLNIRRFSPAAEKQFHLLSADLGQPLGRVRHYLVPAGRSAPISTSALDLEAIAREVIDSAQEREYEARDRDGRWLSLRTYPYLTLDNKIDGALIVFVDIDALKKSERVVKGARDYAEATIRTARDPFIVLRGDLRVNSANDAFYRTFKVTREQTAGRLIYELGNQQWDIPKLRSLLEDVLPRNSFFDDFEMTHNFPQIGRRTMILNARRLNLEDGLPPMILLSIEDVTERLESRAALRTSEIRYRRLFETARDGVLIIDSVSRKITDANPYILELLGYRREELVGKELWEIGLIHDEQASHAVFRQLQEYGMVRYDDLPLQTKTGEKRDVEVIANHYKEGGLSVIQCNIRNITGRKRSEKELAESLAREQKASRAKDEFMAVLSHELRTPLNPVLLLASDSAVDPEIPPHIRANFDTIRKNIELEARLIDDLLDLNHIAHGKLLLNQSELDAHEILNDAVSNIHSDIERKQILVKFDLQAERREIFGDAVRLQQVFWNVLKNAVKFTPEDGQIKIESQTLPGDKFLINITDTGMGMDAGEIGHVFGAFSQGSHRLGGLGLGLAISRQIVELHSGSIRATSEGKGRGATFLIELPLLGPSETSGSSPAS